MVKRTEFKRRRAIIQEACTKVRRLDRTTGAVARELVAQNPDDTNKVPDEEADDVAEESELPHVTHDLRQMTSADVVYCNTCGLWSRDNRHSKLRAECQPIKLGNRSSLRSFRCDIVPKAGARIPPHLKYQSWFQHNT